MQESPPRNENDQSLTEKQNRVLAIVQAHTIAETVHQNVDETMSTMTSNPYLYFNATHQYAVGHDDVRKFYSTRLIGQFLPPDGEMTSVSLVVTENNVFGEVVVRFTHTMQMNWLIPDIPPTGKKVELALAVFVEVRDGKIANERTYWDQASLLYQLGLLDRGNLPISGAESAQTLLALTGIQQRAPSGVMEQGK